MVSMIKLQNEFNMRSQLLFFFFCFVVVDIAHAQCDPKEYARIFNEASTLQEKGEFIDAKNRYEAAKIYACNQQEKDAADVAVDALFGKTVLYLLLDADKDILRLDYNRAFDKISSAASFGIVKDSVAHRLLEIAYVYNHSGKWQIASEITTRVANLLGKPDFAKQAEHITSTNALQSLDLLQEKMLPVRFAELKRQYFPSMITIPRGSFLLENHNGYEVVVKEKSLPDFEMAETETTVMQYNLYCMANNRSLDQRLQEDRTFKNGYTPLEWLYNQPIVNINMYDAMEYANWVSMQQGYKPVYTIIYPEFTFDDTIKYPTQNNHGEDDAAPFKEDGSGSREYAKPPSETKIAIEEAPPVFDDGSREWTFSVDSLANGYRVPNLIEWEYAAKGGEKGAKENFVYAGSNELDKVGWYNKAGRYNKSPLRKTQPVAGKKPNQLGLYDMSGNVWEICIEFNQGISCSRCDNFDFQLNSRGGSWEQDSADCKIKSEKYYPDVRSEDIGFRLERNPTVFGLAHFLESEDAIKLHGYGDYFFGKGSWEEARQLYEKAERLKHKATSLQKLFEISEKTGHRLDFERFLASEHLEELYDYADYFFYHEKWNEARQLFEKIERIKHSPETLQYLHEISENTGQAFDIERFLAVQDPEELSSHARYFAKHSRSQNKKEGAISDLRFAIRLSEKLISFDTNKVAQRLLISNLINLTYYQLLLPDCKAADATLQRIVALDPENEYIPLMRPIILLLNGKNFEAKSLFLLWKDKPMKDSKWEDYNKAYRWILDNLEEERVPGIEFTKIRGWLEK
jgi:formylglycine-generating enzyme required for sulfatase activity